MVGAEQPPSPQLRREGVAEYEDGEAPAGGGGADPQQQGRSPRPRAGPLRRLGEPRTRRAAEARGVALGGVARVPAGVPPPAGWSWGGEGSGEGDRAVQWGKWGMAQRWRPSVGSEVGGA